MAAFYRLEVKPISRQPGSSAVGSAAYRSGKNALSAAAYRNGGKLTDEKTGQTFDYSAKLGVWGAEIIAPRHAPAWMQDRARLWNAVEAVEKRRNSLLAKDHIISLPYELNRAQGEAAIREFVTGHFAESKGMVADVAFHKYGTPYKAWAKNTQTQVAAWQAAGVPFFEKADEPESLDRSFILVLRNKQGGIKEYAEYQPHAHVLLPQRVVEEQGFASHKIRAPNGENTKAWEKQQLRVTRKEWEITCNRHLEMAGSAARVDCRTNEERGIDRIPEPKVGQLATKKERAGEDTLAGQDRRNVVELNAARGQLKAEHAQLMAEEAQIIDLMAARVEKQGMDRDASEKAAAQQPEKIVGLADELKAGERDRATLRREDEAAAAQRADALKTETRRAAEKAARELEERTKVEERRIHEGKIGSAENRYAIALGENYDIRDPYGSLARAALSEYAMFHRRQGELAAEMAQADDPAKRYEVDLRRRIEQAEYMGLTSHRIAGINEAIGGKGHSQSAILEHMRGDAFDSQAKALREERAAFLAAPEKEQRAEMAAQLAGLAKEVEAGKLRDGEPGEEKRHRAAAPARQQDTNDLAATGQPGVAAAAAKPEAEKQAQADGRNQKDSAEAPPDRHDAAVSERPRAGTKDYSALSDAKREQLAALDREFAETQQRHADRGASRARGGQGR